jgi:hypothetical protein
MSEATDKIARDLEERRHRLMLQHVVLSNQTLALAYDVAVHNSFIARQRLRDCDHTRRECRQK